jgi:hypothetical protein
MATLHTLPDELVLLCAKYLPADALRNLTSVSRRFLPIAEDLLYQEPQLELYHGGPLPQCNTISRLKSFARTLIRRPDLAYKVQALEMITSRHDTGHNSLVSHISSSEDDEAARFIQEIGQTSVQWSMRVEDWQARLDLGDGHAWGGLVLTLVLRLRTLVVDIRSRDGLEKLDNWDVWKYAHSPLE